MGDLYGGLGSDSAAGCGRCSAADLDPNTERYRNGPKKWTAPAVTRLDPVQATAGVGQELIVVTAAVIGGCLLTGGFGSAIGASLGCLVFGMTQIGIVYAGWDADWFKTFLGVMLLLAVLSNELVKRAATTRGATA